MDLCDLTIFNRYAKCNKRRTTLINPIRKYNNTVPFIRPYCVNIIIIICDSNKQYRVSRKLHPTEHNSQNVCQRGGGRKDRGEDSRVGREWAFSCIYLYLCDDCDHPLKKCEENRLAISSKRELPNIIKPRIARKKKFLKYFLQKLAIIGIVYGFRFVFWTGCQFSRF